VATTSAQVKEARKLLDWALKTLEGNSGVTLSIIANFEAEKRRASVLQLTVLRRVIAAAGVDNAALKQHFFDQTQT
jgi:hypothetical protein